MRAARQSTVSLYNNNAVDVALTQAQKARALLGTGPVVSPEAAYLRADAIRAEGDTFLWTEDYARARGLHLETDRFIAGLPVVMQRDAHMMSLTAGNLRLLGEAHHKLKQPVKARAVLDRVVVINQAVLATQPDDPLFRRRVVVSLRYRAIVHHTNERDELARESIEAARVERSSCATATQPTLARCNCSRWSARCTRRYCPTSVAIPRRIGSETRCAPPIRS